MIKIAVGSQNPVKIEATKEAFLAIWPHEEFKIEGVSVPSGVSNQPMSDEESITGAKNRAKAALQETGADYGVGLEGGLQEIKGVWFDCGWVVIVDKEGSEGIGATVKMETPPKAIDMIKQGKELGEVMDILFERTNTKQAEGHFGLMTHNAITRTRGLRDAVISALARFLQPQLYPK
jgi:inosine/xanthosine triphosphatase